MYYDFGLLNSCVTQYILTVLSPTLNYEAGQIAALPVLYCTGAAAKVRTNLAEYLEKGIVK